QSKLYLPLHVFQLLHLLRLCLSDSQNNRVLQKIATNHNVENFNQPSDTTVKLIKGMQNLKMSKSVRILTRHEIFVTVRRNASQIIGKRALSTEKLCAMKPKRQQKAKCQKIYAQHKRKKSQN
ncbi:hypothetical protein Bhyg_07148, partial [Pseudolycoriella hygida]